MTKQPEAREPDQPLALSSSAVLGPNAQDVARESVDDALMIVESYGPWGADLNDAHRRQIVLADEVVRLRGLYEMAVRGRAEMRSALRQERRAEELHEGCQMPMEQARELAASEMSESRKALLTAFGAAAAAREQDLRGQYPKAARVLAEEVFSLRAALRQKCAEYDDMKSLLLGSARNLNLEGEQARQTAEYWKAEHLAGNTRIGELHDELAETASRAADYLRRAIKAEAEVALLRAAGLGA
jgi:hypothetical protein